LERLRGYVTLDEDERSGRKAGDAHAEMTDGEWREGGWVVGGREGWRAKGSWWWPEQL
jgi:hypothetical protein